MNIASTLAWILGGLNLLGGIVLGIPAVAMKKPIIFPLVIFMAGIGLCFSGYGLRKRKVFAGVTAILFSVASFISPPLIGLVVGTAIIILTAVHWKELS